MYPFARTAAVALLVALAVAILPTQSQASCTGSNRITDDNSDCMVSSYRNKSWPNNNAYDAKNLCHQIGKIVVKVDIKGLVDKTWHISGSSTYRNTSPNANTVRGIYCCKDLGDLCNKADVLTDESCAKEYTYSAATSRCRNETVTVSGYQCEVDGECGRRIYDTGVWVDTYWYDASIVANLGEMRDLYNCYGALQVGECD